MTQKDPLAELPWPGATVTPSQTCSEAIRGTCTKGLCKQRGVSATGRGLLTLGLSVLLLAFYTWYAWTDRRPSSVVITGLYGAMGWLGAQALLLFITLVRPPGRRGSRALRLALLISVPVLFVAYLGFVSTEQFALSKFAQLEYSGHALGCGLLALLMGALVAGGALFAWRHTDPYSPGMSGAAIGVIAGISSGVGMTVACPSHEAIHSCVAHGLIVFALAALGFGLGRRLLPP